MGLAQQGNRKLYYDIIRSLNIGDKIILRARGYDETRGKIIHFGYPDNMAKPVEFKLFECTIGNKRTNVGETALTVTPLEELNGGYRVSNFNWSASMFELVEANNKTYGVLMSL